jgi:hypothetical protein
LTSSKLDDILAIGDQQMEVGKNFMTNKSYMVIGNFTENEPYFCTSLDMAREVFCEILKQQDLVKYLTEDQLSLFKSLTSHWKFKKAVRHWRSCGSDANLRIERANHVVWKPVRNTNSSIINYGLSSKDLFGTH